MKEVVMNLKNILLGTVLITWQATPGAAGYKVYIGTKSRTYSQVVNVPGADVTTYNAGDLDLKKRTYIAVTSYNAFGESKFSNEMVATTPTPPKLKKAEIQK